jgi:NTE family protein
MTEVVDGKSERTRLNRSGIRTAVVLSAGGLRGAAHVGVLRQLVRHGVPIDAIVGVSAGAVIAAYYAAVGLDLDELIADAERFRGRHLLTYSVNVHLHYRFERALAAWCGVIPERLRQLETARFDRLHHGVRCLGIVCHDVPTGQPQYFWTGCDQGAALHAVVRASASIPHLFPTVPIACAERQYRLTDGGLSDPVPLALCRGAISATHVIVSDCRWIGGTPATDADTVWIRPRMAGTGTLWSPRQGLRAAVSDGEAAVTPQILQRIAMWFSRDPCGSPVSDGELESSHGSV